MNRLFPILVVLAAACTPVPQDPGQRDAICRDLFRNYDSELRTDRTRTRLDRLVLGERRITVGPGRRGAEAALWQYGCVTMAGGLPEPLVVPARTLAAAGGRSGYVHVALVNSHASETAIAQAFRAAGYPVQTRGAPGMGRRVFIGPFGAAAPLEEALRAARAAGFGAAYALNAIP